MNGLWDTLLDAGIELASDPETLHQVVEKARTWAPPTGDTSSQLLHEALDVLDANAELVASEGPRRVLALAGIAHERGSEEARLAYLRKHATYEEIREARQNARRESLEEADSVWESVWAVVQQLLPVMGDAAKVGLLLAGLL